MEKILDKLKKLLRQEEGERTIGNLAAAELFAAKAQELLTKHRLSMADVDLHDEQSSNDDVDEEVFSVGRDSDRRRTSWKSLLINSVAKANECFVIVVPGSNRVHLIGPTESRELVKTLYLYFADLGEHLANQHREGRRFHNAFLLGYAVAIGERLKTSNKEVIQREASSNALISLRNQDEAVKKFVKQRHPKLASATTTYSSREGYVAGHRAGSRVSLSGKIIK